MVAVVKKGEQCGVNGVQVGKYILFLKIGRWCEMG